MFLSDSELILRKNEKHTMKSVSRRKKPMSGHGKWMVLAHIAKYLTLTVTELFIQLPGWCMEIKELHLAMYNEEAGLSLLGVNLLLMTCIIFESKKCRSWESPSHTGFQEKSIGELSSMTDKVSAPFSIEQLQILSTLGHKRERGVMVKHADVTCGEMVLNLTEELFQTKKCSMEATSPSEYQGNGQCSSASGMQAGQTYGKTLHDNAVAMIPEKVSFSLPKMLLKCCHKERGIFIENEVSGIFLRSTRSQVFEDTGDNISHLDIHVDSGEFQLLREADKSLVEIMKVAVAASVEIPSQPGKPFRVEVDIKLGGAQCNLLTSKLERWLYMGSSIKKSDSERFLPVKGSVVKKKILQPSTRRVITWTCTISAPEMAVSVCSLDGLILYNVCLQTSHLFINSIVKQGIAIHTELGELCIYMVGKGLASFRENLFGVDTNPGCLLQISRVTVDWGPVDSECREDVTDEKRMLVLEISGSVLYLTLERLQYILSLSITFATLYKKHFGMKSNEKSRSERAGKYKTNRKGVTMLKLSLEGFSTQFCDQLHVINMDIPDPKKVSFGNQGGDVVIAHDTNGKLRIASIEVASFGGVKGEGIQCKATIDLAHLSLQIDKDMNNSQIQLQRIRAFYQEFGRGDMLITEVTLLALQNGTIVHRTVLAGQGNSSCSLICASDLIGRWEPGAHLFIHNVVLKVKSLLKMEMEKIHSGIIGRNFMESNARKSSGESSQKCTDPDGGDQKHFCGRIAIAVDMDHLEVSAALADGVEGFLFVQSVFSEDVRIGVLLEEVRASLNNATIMRSARLQIARLPSFIGEGRGLASLNESFEAENSLFPCWDYLVQGSGIQLVMPYRLECRAIEDAVEDMWRGLKLVMVAQRHTVSGSNASDMKPHKKSSSSLGSIKFVLSSISAEIEEEPFQGWLDEHYQMIRRHACEIAVREQLLDEVVAEGDFCVNPNSIADTRDAHITIANGRDFDMSEPKEKLHQQVFQSYLQECKKLQGYESSGSCRSAFQLGFTPSTNRGSVLRIQASGLEVTLRDIRGGTEGMVEQIRRLDCVNPDIEIPFSRVLGKHASIMVSSLSIQQRNYTCPLLFATHGKCEGYIIFARQATCFPKQSVQEVYIGRWRKLKLLRSESGTTPPYKIYLELPIEFEKMEVAYGEGFEPALADVSYAFTVALRKADLSVHDLVKDHKVLTSCLTARAPNVVNQPLKKERSLPWWDDMRYYVHGRNSITATNFKWVFLATTDPYEKGDMMNIVADLMEIQQSEGRLSFTARSFNLIITSLENLVLMKGSKRVPLKQGRSFICSPFFQLDISMVWDCESGNPLNHYLHALPIDLATREKVYDPFRSTSLALEWKFHLSSQETEDNIGRSGDFDTSTSKSRHHNGLFPRKSLIQKVPKEVAVSSHSVKEESVGSVEIPRMNLGVHDLIWIFKWWALYYSPPHKLRTFSKWPRFGVPVFPRSGNLSLDKVLTEFMLRVDATPAQIKHVSMVRDDPARGLTFDMKKLKYELCYSRGKQRYTFESKRDILELVYQGLDLHMVKAELKRDMEPQTRGENSQGSMKGQQMLRLPDGKVEEPCQGLSLPANINDRGFLLSTDYFTMRKQAPKANPMRLTSWQERGLGFNNNDASYGGPDLAYGSGSDLTRSDPSDDDGINAVLADNCLHVSLYGLKLLWTIANRDAVWAWVEDISRAFESPKPSPSRQYAERKLIEEQTKLAGIHMRAEESSRPASSPNYCKLPSIPASLSQQEKSFASSSPSRKAGDSSSVSSAPLTQGWPDDMEEGGTMHFMVNVVHPQFNLHSEDARGRLLLAAASGRVIARSFHSIIYVKPEIIKQAFKIGGEQLHGAMPELTWKRRELSVLLEHVQAHVAPTDVDPGAGLQWLPKIPRGAPKVKRTGALLERIFMPCTMYFQYIRYKSGTADLKVKPIKELSFNSPNITATMTSRQFQAMVDVISDLLLARLPKPRRNSLVHYDDEELRIEEEADEVVSDGVEEVELARIKLEQTERELKLLLDDTRTLSQGCNTDEEVNQGSLEGKPRMALNGNAVLICRLEDELGKRWKARKMAAISLRYALQKAAQQRLAEKEKNKSPSFAMRMSWAIDKVVWSMLSDAETFAEAEISSMILNVDRDYHDVGVAQFTTKHFVVRNCLPNAKSDTILSAWNPPAEWGRNVMLRVDAKQGAPKDGHSPLELFLVEIYPLKIYLTERMYRMMWGYFFPEEDQDSQRRQVWEASTTAVVKRGKKVAYASNERVTSRTENKREEASAKAISSKGSHLGIHPHFVNEDLPHVDFQMVAQALEKHAKKGPPNKATHRRTSSCDRTWEEDMHANLAWEITPKMSLQPLVPSSKHTSLTHPGEADSGSQTSTSISTNNTENGSTKLKEGVRASKLSKALPYEDKKLSKVSSQEDKKESRLRQSNLEFHHIKISQVELLVTYEGSRFAFSDLRLLMDTFTRVEFTGTWRRLFSRVKKHIIWGVLKSLAGMQGKKFKDKLQAQGQAEGGGYPGSDSDSSDSGSSNADIYKHFPISQFKRQSDRAGEGFVSSIRGLFNSQRRKAKALVLRTMGVDDDPEFPGDWTESEADSASFTRQLSISKAKHLLRLHTKKLLSTRHRGGIAFKDQLQASPKRPSFHSEASSDASSCYEDFNE